jgi:hypothetical protein
MLFKTQNGLEKHHDHRVAPLNRLKRAVFSRPKRGVGSGEGRRATDHRILPSVTAFFLRLPGSFQRKRLQGSSVEHTALTDTRSPRLSISCSKYALAVLVLPTVFLISTPPAYAGTGYGFLGSFGEFNAPRGAAVDNGSGASSGDVYITDAVNERVVKFNAGGTEQLAELKYTPTEAEAGEGKKPLGVVFWDAVDPITGDVYASDIGGGAVTRFSPAGSFISQITEATVEAAPVHAGFHPSGVAVDGSGRLFVADLTNGVIDRFSAAGVYETQFADETSVALSIAIDASANVYVTDAEAAVRQFSASGAPVTTPPCVSNAIDSETPVAVAVDPADGAILVGEGGETEGFYIARYSSPCASSPVKFGAGHFVEGSVGIAVSAIAPNQHAVYAVSDSGNIANIFAPVPLPDATTGAANVISPVEVQVAGSVNPETLEASCVVQYGTGSVTEHSTPCEPASLASGAGEAPVKATLTGLTPQSSYQYRVVAENVNGQAPGETLSFETPPAVEGVKTEAASAVTGTAATLNGALKPNGIDAHYYFQWGTTEAYGSTAPEPPADAGTVAELHAQANLTGLTPTGVYHYRLVAENQYGTTYGEDQQLKTTAVAPTIAEESALGVTATSATLEASLNPGGAETTYHFQYGTTTEYGQTIPQPDATVATGLSPVTVQMHLAVLQPGTIYHYRLVAANAIETISGPDQTFTTQAATVSTALADGRRYELVSPPDKHGTDVIGPVGYGIIQAAESGAALTYATFGPPVATPPSNALANQLYSVRGLEGWEAAQDISPPHTAPTNAGAGETPEYRAFSADLSLGLIWAGPGGLGVRHPVEDEPLSGSGAPAGYQNYYLRENDAGKVQALMQLPFTPEEPSTIFEMELLGATQDLKHIVVTSQAALSLGMPNASGFNLYEWTDGAFQAINVLPNGAPDPVPATGELKLGNGPGTGSAISSDGKRVAWKDFTTFYIRKNIGTPQVETVEMPSYAERFYLMNKQGTEIFFGAGERGKELYKFDVDTNQATRLATGTVDVLGASDDGSFLYFVSRDAVVSGAESGGYNLYVWHGGQIALVATLSPADSSQASILALGEAGDWTGSLATRTVRVSPDGKHMIFMSGRSLTGYDNVISGATSCARDRNGNALPAQCEEVFRYDATASGLTCVSCNPDGGRPVGPSGIHGGEEFDNFRAMYLPRMLSSDGGRVFFDSADALASYDTNGRKDVYQWEQNGTGSCHAAGGCTSLISAGGTGVDSTFVDASASGNDVFFVTRDQLVSQDFDHSQDVYDAHVCTSVSPCSPSPPVSPPACVTGDSCRPAPSPQPAVFGAPASATFSGLGNLPPAPPATPGRQETNAQKLARALKACHRKKPHKKRTACERQARHRYGSKGAKARANSHRGNR